MSTGIFAQTITLSTETIPAANIAQGSANTILYIAKMDVTVSPVTVTTMQFTLTGTHDNNDLTTYRIYANSTASLAGATLLSSMPATFAAPNTYNDDIPNQLIAAGITRYFIISVFTDPLATHGNTIKIDGAANPVTFTYTTVPTVVNNQSNAAGLQTITASSVNISSESIAASNVAQGSSNNIVYIAKMDVAVSPVTVTTMQFTLTGTHDNNDLTTYRIYVNSSPSLAGATLTAISPATFAAPHTYNEDIPDQTIAAGNTRYFIITFFADAAATNGNTVKLNGAANPGTFTYTTAPTITNNQTDAAGAQTITAPNVAISSEAIAAANVAQGSANNIVYIVKMDVTGSPVTVATVQFTLTGTHDNNDLTNYRIYFNSTPSLTGAIFIANAAATFAAPHTYNNDFPDQTIAAGSTGYFIISFYIDAAATNGNTVKLNGASNPVTFTYTTAPTITNNQTDAAGTQTIQAAGITLSSETLAASPLYRSSANNIIYILKTDVVVSTVIVATMQFTLTGTHDNNDLTNYRIYYNTAPSLTGAILIANAAATFAAPNIYTNDIPDQTIPSGATRYFIVTISVDAAATIGNTVKLNAAVNPVVLTYTTTPPATNNQTDAAGVGTISSTLPLSLLSISVVQTAEQQSELRWQTASEINTKDFEVEWSYDGLPYRTIAAVNAAGNSTQTKQYMYVHKLPADGNNFYRLKMKDLDGRFTFSPVVKIKITISIIRTTVFPNPVTDVLNLNMHSLKNEQILLYLCSSNGKVAVAKTFFIVKGNNTLKWNIQTMAAGVYYISCDNKNFAPLNIFKQ